MRKVLLSIHCHHLVGWQNIEVNKLCKDNLPKYQIDENSNKIKNSKNDKDRKLIFSFKNIKNWYDGYRLFNSRKNKKYEMFTPYSVIKSLSLNLIDNYWNKSETYLNLSKFIDLDFSELKNDIAILINNKKTGLK